MIFLKQLLITFVYDIHKLTDVYVVHWYELHQ